MRAEKSTTISARTRSWARRRNSRRLRMVTAALTTARQSTELVKSPTTARFVDSSRPRTSRGATAVFRMNASAYAELGIAPLGGMGASQVGVVKDLLHRKTRSLALWGQTGVDAVAQAAVKRLALKAGRQGYHGLGLEGLNSDSEFHGSLQISFLKTIFSAIRSWKVIVFQWVVPLFGAFSLPNCSFFSARVHRDARSLPRLLSGAARVRDCSVLGTESRTSMNCSTRRP
jgi:hypothetical protein